MKQKKKAIVVIPWGWGVIIVKFSHIAQALGSHTSETIRHVWSVNRFSDLPAVTFGALL